MPLVHREFQSCLNFVSVFAVHIFYHRQSGTPTTTAGIPVKASTCQYSYMRRAIWKKGQNWTGWTVAGSLDSNKPGPVLNKTSVSKQGTLTALTALTAFTAWTALTTASVLRLWYQFQCSLWGRVRTLRWPSCQAVSRTDAANRRDTDRIPESSSGYPQHPTTSFDNCKHMQQLFYDELGFFKVYKYALSAIAGTGVSLLLV